MANQPIRNLAKNIKLLLLDVDGVLTDGRIIYNSRGDDYKFFDVHDGMGVHLLTRAGIPVILITAKSSKAITPRARDMGVAAVYGGVSPKSSVFSEIIGKYRVKPQSVCFVGDDLVDLCLMKLVGLPVAVSNAVPEVKRRARYITTLPGGRGAVREVAEVILKAQGRWQRIVQGYHDA
jgi:3-deoxy-D-manno-octulosonate 8-phosphate phosphatase (KDO 8-P phosphatase)